MKYRVKAFNKEENRCQVFDFNDNYVALRLACIMVKNAKFERITVTIVE